MIYTTVYVVWNKKESRFVGDAIYLDKDMIEPLTDLNTDLEIKEMKLALAFGYTDQKIDKESIPEFLVYDVMKE
jgi:hypothetical protein